MSIQADQLQNFALNGSGAIIGDTTLVLKSMQTIDGANVVMGDFGTIGYGTIEPGNNALEEQISFSGITQNSNGTATLTGVRSVGFAYPYTSTSGLAKTHAGSTVFIISNTAAFTSSFANKNNAEVITENWQVPDPIGMTDIANKEWVLSVVNGGTVSVDKLVPAAIADATVAAGNVLYLKTNGRWAKADASAVASSVGVILGVAQGAGTSGNAISGGVIIEGLDANQSGLVAGSSYYLTNMPGTISTVPGTFSVQVGVGSTDATKIFFSPEVGMLNKALVSNLSIANGVPQANSAGFISNTYIGNLLTADVDQSQTTSNSTITVGEANATTKHAQLAEKFIPTIPSIRGVKLWKIADTGSFTGTVTITLQADTAGAPSGVVLATTTIPNATWLKLTAAAEFGVAFSSEYSSLAIGGAYWIVISTSTNDNSNHPNIGANSAGGYASGLVRYFNPTDNWVTINTSILYFKTLEGVQSKISQTNSEGLPIVQVRPYSVIDIGTTVVTITSSASETTVYSKEIPGGFFTANAGLRALIRGVATGAGGTDNTLAIKLKYNGNAIATITAPTALGSGNGAASWDFNTELIFLNNNSVSSQIIFGIMNPYPASQSGTATAVSVMVTPPTTFTTSAVDVSGPGLLEITFTNSSGAGTSSSSFKAVLLEKIAG